MDADTLWRLKIRHIDPTDPDALQKLRKIEDREIAHFKANRISSYKLDGELYTIKESQVMPEPVNEENKVVPVEKAQSGLGSAAMPQVVVVIATVVVVAASTVLALPAAGVAVPAVVTAIASVLVAVGAALGIASPGIRK